ncbi:UPF0505 protein C16orf62 homolog [Phalaenopsis equestris]|uniref:UPF0505 protein C16orf62 homolog n=1 Tax=Phalaenopsis equestris TaxID=78828 RepID=UPI0009E38815|nr:UPF0505 protein C16orf62 homolog [Phalaenopsis equestris]
MAIFRILCVFSGLRSLGFDFDGPLNPSVTVPFLGSAPPTGSSAVFASLFDPYPFKAPPTGSSAVFASLFDPYPFFVLYYILYSDRSVRPITDTNRLRCGMEFRCRDFLAQDSSLPRTPVQVHPLTAIRTDAVAQIDATSPEKVDFEDPLRANAVDGADPSSSVQRFDYTFRRSLSDEVGQFSAKEWAVFSKALLQKFSYSNMITMPAALDTLPKNNKEHNKSLADVHMEELEDPEMMINEEKKVITQQEYVSRLQELKTEIARAWKADDRIKALKISIKVSRLLIDTSVLQFYPTLFLLVIDVMDMFGDLVWERIKKKVEYSDDGTLICSLPENFLSVDVCSEAKETCYNWFCKIGSIRELLPRIYLELALLHCRRFLEDHHLHSLQRLARMMRGLADPLASAYCHLYLAHRAALVHCNDTGYLIMSISDINFSLRRIISDKQASQSDADWNHKLSISLIEPTIEWIMKCLLMEGRQKPNDILKEFGFGSGALDPTWKVPWTSVIIHHLVRQLPSKIISAYVFEILEIFELIKDISLNQHLNYRVLGLKLCESPPHICYVESILNRVMQVLSQYNHLEEYLVVANAYLDIILQCPTGSFLSSILDGILKLSKYTRVDETELDALQSILMKLLKYFSSIENAFASEQFMAVYVLLHGISQNVINLHILEKATRSGSISNPTTIQMLFEISKALLDSIDILNKDYQRISQLICHFVQLVGFGDDRESHLTFLVTCRSAFSYFDMIVDTLVLLSNNLAIGAIKGSNKLLNFVKACVAFSEVTIPSIPDQIRCMKLFIATAEIALFAGLFSHTEGLLNSAVDSLLCLDVSGSHISVAEDEILPLTCKLCSILAFMPGMKGGIAQIHMRLMPFIDNQPWATSRMRTKIFCAVISLCACLSQKLLPPHSKTIKVVGHNEMLFFRDESYEQELKSVTRDAVQCLFKTIERDPASLSTGKFALEACNCLLINFKANHELHLKCSKLIKIASSCLPSNDNYLRTSANLFNQHFQNL